MSKINTKQRYDTIEHNGHKYRLADDYGNTFSEELRKVDYLDAIRNHITAIDVDVSLYNYMTGNCILIETKNCNAPVNYAQTSHLINLSGSMANNPKFGGVYLLQYLGHGMDSGTHISYLANKSWKQLKENGEQVVFTKEKVFKFIQWLMNK